MNLFLFTQAFSFLNLLALFAPAQSDPGGAGPHPDPNGVEATGGDGVGPFPDPDGVEATGGDGAGPHPNPDGGPEA